VIAKLVRQVTSGESFDVTLPQHLRNNGFDHVPGVAGTLDVQLQGEAAPATIVVVHDAVHNDSDLWEWSQDVLTREVERLVSEPDAHGEDAATMAVTELLAERTAQMHDALAGGAPGFEPERFSLHWQRSILQSMRASLRETQRQVRRRMPDLPPDAVPLAEAVLADGDHLLAAFEALGTRKLDASRIRVHGDFHLGQALWTGHDVVFIDFEGEPGRSAGERAIKRSPLMDVGGIFRSFDYAGRVALATSEERGRAGEAQRPRLEHWREDWTDRAQSRFWESYVSALNAARPDLIPTDADDARLLLDAHVLIKALYEVRYEIANRPAWVGWPLAAIATMLAERSA